MKLFHSFFIFLFLCLLTGAEAQNLPRKVMLGVSAQPLTEETAKSNNLKIGDGLQILAIIPNGTFAEIGIKNGDILLSINQKTIGTPQDLIASAQSLNSGDAVEITVISNGAKVTKKGTAKARPKETSDYGEVVLDEVDTPLGKQRSIIHIPKNKTGKLPTVFFLQGYPCGSQEFPPNSKNPAKRLIDDWVKSGFVVFRVERPNIGDSKTSKNCADIDYSEEVAFHDAAYKKLLGYDYVDKSNVFLFGHSLGGITAPLLAEAYQPKGIIVYGTGIKSWFEYFLELHRIQTVYFGGSIAEGEKQARELLPIYYEWLELGKSPTELKQNPKYKEILEAPNNPLSFSGDYSAGRHSKFWQTMNQTRMSEAWSKVASKVLAIYAEFDVQALNSFAAEEIARIVNENNAGNGEFLLIPKAEHGFAKVESYRQVTELFSTGKYGQYAEQNYSEDVAVKTIEWMERIMK
jgi:uncharacterized protein